MNLMNNDYPRMLYKKGTSVKLDGKLFDTCTVKDLSEEKLKHKDSYRRSTLEALKTRKKDEDPILKKEYESIIKLELGVEELEVEELEVQEKKEQKKENKSPGFIKKFGDKDS